MVAENGHIIVPIPGPRILICRHGKTQQNQEHGTPGDVVRGQSNFPMTPEGVAEAKNRAEMLKGARISELYSSPLNRAIVTAREIGKPYGLKPRKKKELLPWDMGEFTGMSATVAKPLLRKYAEEHPMVPVRGGESFVAWKKRLLGWIRKLMQHVEGREVTVCCVTHSRCIKLLEGWIKMGTDNPKIDFDLEFKDDTEPGGIYDFRPNDNGKWRIHQLSKGYVVKGDSGVG
jgi:broad specificity phosphatase PhoE